MSQARIIINLSDREQVHSNGLSGTWTVPGKKLHEDFAILVVYPTPEIQDIGDQRRVMHWLKATPLAKDIVGLRSDAAAHGMGVSGTKEKWGLLLCEAEPDLPRELLKAIEAEIEYLNNNLPDYKFRKDKESGAVVATNVEPAEVSAKKQELSDKVRELREEFEASCRKMVAKKELHKAKAALTHECQRLVAEGDRMWARPAEQQNINELHRWSCAWLGQERPWCYIPQQLIDCPGCGAKIKENILSCPHCAGFLDEGIEELRVMKPKERSMKMYPERYAEPVTAGATGQQRG
jgi:hypothetical protein